MSHKLARVKPQTPTSYLMMPNQPEIQRFGLCSLEHPILDSPFRFEQRTDKEP